MRIPYNNFDRNAILPRRYNIHELTPVPSQVTYLMYLPHGKESFQLDVEECNKQLHNEDAQFNTMHYHVVD